MLNTTSLNNNENTEQLQNVPSLQEQKVFNFENKDDIINLLEDFSANEIADFFCEYCNRKFCKKSNLTHHKQTHLIVKQLNARHKTYHCKYCLVSFKIKALLNKHVEIVHNVFLASNISKNKKNLSICFLF